jgi:hypothetical protein
MLVNLIGKAAVFTGVERPGIAIEHRANRDGYTDYFPVAASKFTNSGISLTLRTSLRRATFRAWLLNKSMCPDTANISSLHTDRVMVVESAIQAPLCLFPKQNGAVYRVDAQNGSGLTQILFYAPRGKGHTSKLCQGETDVCSIETSMSFLMLFEGTTQVNISFNRGLSLRLKMGIVQLLEYQL